MGSTDIGHDGGPVVRHSAASDGDMPPTRLGRLAWPLAASWLLAWLTTVALVIANRSAIQAIEDADPVDMILPIGFAVIGTLLAVRKPRNPTGWIFLGIAILGALSGISTQYVFRSSNIAHLPLTAWVGWVHDPLNWLVFPAGLATFFFLLFPDGHLASRRWRWVAWFAVVVVCVGFGFLVFQTSIQLAGSPPILNPLGKVAVVDMDNGAPGVIWVVGLAVIVTAMAGTVLRMRRSSGEPRQQLRWLAFATALTAVAMVGLVASFAVGLNPPNAAFDAILVLGYGIAVPVSCGIAILKHGLYDIDRIINRTFVYALVTGGLAAGYFGLVLLFQLVTPAGGGSPVVVAVSTLAVAAAFRPLRSRVQAYIDRRFYRSKYDAQQTLADFSAKMRDEIDLDSLITEMMAVVRDTVQPIHVSLWLRS